MSHIPQDFMDVSRDIGADGLLIQGAGGNTSIKIGANLMWVKASGKWLQHGDREDIFAAVDWSRVNGNIGAGHDDPTKGAVLPMAGDGLRPSIETTLHSLMPHDVVFHTHSINTIVHAIQQDAVGIMSPKLDGIQWGFVPYSKPGLQLTRLVSDVLAARHCDVLVIQNHGLVVGGDSPAETLTLMRDVETRLVATPRPLSTPSLEPLAEACSNTNFVIAASDIIHQLALNSHGFELARSGSLYPDHVVFLGSGIAGVETMQEFTSFCRAGTDDPLRPKAIALKGMGVVHDKSLSSGGIEMLTALAQVIRRAPGHMQPRYLSRSEEQDLVNWDAEKYRQTL